MFKHPKCGGQHETVAQARACEQGGGVATKQTTTYTSADGNVEIQVRVPAAPAKASSAVLERLREQGVRSINAPRRGYVREASTGARKYLVDLLDKRDYTELEELGWKCEHMRRMLTREDYTPGYDECSEMIEALKTCPYREARAASHPVSPAPQGAKRVDRSRVKALKDKIPDGRYAVDLPGGDKVKFYALRTSKHNGYFTVTHHVSDDRYPVAYSRYEEIFTAILAAGVQAAGKRYADEYGKCYNCGRALTDTDNPYKPYGLGPDCGPKVMG